ncbi:MAG: peptide deformylase [Aeromicrobium sp.]|nr:peptide deformylase [Aeromicrobium sp.]
MVDPVDAGDRTRLNDPTRMPPEDVHPITLYGHPALMTRCREVSDFDSRLQRLVDRMFESMYATGNGVGLAANQIGRTISVFVFDCQDGVVGHVVNPTIEVSGDDRQIGHEGCLSLPGLSLDTVRALNAGVTGYDVTGRRVEYEGTGLRARCFQHEVDHLNGRVFIDNHSPLVRRTAINQMRAAPWFGETTLDPRSADYQELI